MRLGFLLRMFQLFAVSAVVMGLSYTIAKEEMFHGFRDRCGGRGTWLGYLVSCPYCLSHWVAFVIVPLTGSYYVHMSARNIPFVTPIVDWFLSSILVTVVAAFLRVIFFFVDETQGFVRRRKRVAEKEAEAIEEQLPH
jgi:uncharacterized membrane protein